MTSRVVKTWGWDYFATTLIVKTREHNQPPDSELSWGDHVYLRITPQVVLGEVLLEILNGSVEPFGVFSRWKFVATTPSAGCWRTTILPGIKSEAARYPTPNGLAEALAEDIKRLAGVIDAIEHPELHDRSL